MCEEIQLQKTEMYCLDSVQMGITYLVCFELPLSSKGSLNLGSFRPVGPVI